MYKKCVEELKNGKQIRIKYNKKINIYCGLYRNTVIKQRPVIKKDFVFQIKCLECGGTGTFNCGIKDEFGICISCKGTGNQYIGTI